MARLVIFKNKGPIYKVGTTTNPIALNDPLIVTLYPN